MPIPADVLILAHRGAHAPETPGVRENTVEAFRRADLADGVELDVRRAPDGRLVVVHDRIEGPLAPWVPTLEEALEACTGLVNVEIKSEPGLGEEVAVALRGASNVVVSSFNLAELDAFHAAAPTIPTGWLTLPGYDQIDAVRTAAEHGHTAVHPPVQATTPDLIDVAHAAGLRAAVWTVNDPAAVPAGADIVITDVPHRMLSERRSPERR